MMVLWPWVCSYPEVEFQECMVILWVESGRGAEVATLAFPAAAPHLLCILMDRLKVFPVFASIRPVGVSWCLLLALICVS